MKHIGILKLDPENPLHQKLAKISKNLTNSKKKVEKKNYFNIKNE